MKKLSISLFAVLAIAFAVSSAFTTKKAQSAFAVEYKVLGTSETLDKDNYISLVPFVYENNEQEYEDMTTGSVEELFADGTVWGNPASQLASFESTGENEAGTRSFICERISGQQQDLVCLVYFSTGHASQDDDEVLAFTTGDFIASDIEP